MTDATICEVEGCHALIPTTLDDRREHRRGHAHDRKVIEALRQAMKDQNVTIRRLAGRLDDLERDVSNIEIPEAPDPFTLVPADDLDPLEDDPDDEDIQVSQYVDDEDDFDEPTRDQTRADAEAAFANVPPAIDRDDDGYFTPRPA